MESIEHKGFVYRISGQSVIVKIISESACAACHSRGACSVSEMRDKEVEVSGVTENFNVGENVNLVMEQSQGYKAVLIGYVYPFMLMFAGLLSFSSFGFTELSAGLLAIGLLPPYYFIAYLLRNKIRKNFTFSIRKID